MPDPSCRWCGQPLDATAERPDGRVRCRRCGVAVTDPWHSLEHLAEPGAALRHATAQALVRRLLDLGLTGGRVSHWRGGQVLFGWLQGLVGLLPGHPDLSGAIRRPEARSGPVRARPPVGRAALRVSAAGVGAVVDVALRPGRTVYVEARRP